MQQVRFLKENFVGRNISEVSEEIRPDRMRSDLILTGIDAQGGFDIEMSASFDAYLEALLCGTWDTTGDATFTDGVAVLNSTTFTSATAAFTTGDVGKRFVAPVANIPANTFIATFVNATTVTLSNAAILAGTALSFTIKARTAGNKLINGVVNRSWLVEKGYLDVNQFFQYRGMVFNTLVLTIAAKKRALGTFGFMGQKPTRSATTVSGSIVPPLTVPIMASGPNVTGIELNPNMAGVVATELVVNINNNLRTRDNVESLTTSDLGRGPFDCTVTIRNFFADGLAFDAFVANQYQAFSFAIGDGLRNYTFNLPKAKFASITVETPGIMTDVPEVMELRALADPVTNAELIITRT
jgi:hypothetical protein